MSKLKYIGRGRSLHGIPARDLTDAEGKEHGKARLLATGLYIELTRRKTKNQEVSDYGRYKEITQDPDRKGNDSGNAG